MAIAFDAAANSGGPATSSLTWSHTCGGSNGLLVVGLFGAEPTIGVTYNGVSMTSGGVYETNPNLGDISLWYLLGPSTGSHSIVATDSGGGWMDGVSASYTGVAQTGQPDAARVLNNFDPGGSGAATLTTSITTVANNAWTVLVAQCYYPSATIAAGTGSTQRTLESSWQVGLYDSNGPKTPAGSTSMAVVSTASANNSAAAILISFAPAASSPSGNGLLALL